MHRGMRRTSPASFSRRALTGIAAIEFSRRISPASGGRDCPHFIERLRDGTARNIVKPGHVFSRLHHDDCATAVLAALERQAAGAFNLCDDKPASASEVMAYAARLTGLPMPAAIAWDDPSLSPGVRRFYQDNKRVSNARAKAVLGWRPRFPTYREGLDSLLERDRP